MVHHGAGAYICGEETALAESPKGEGHAAAEAAVPANVGLYGCPTTVNNVGIDRGRPTILRRGASWFAGIGRPNNAGTKLFGISGPCEPSCVVEDAMSITLKELIETPPCGGVRGGWKNLKAVIPGGSSVPILPAAQCETAIWISTGCASSALGHGTAVIVMDQSTDVIKAIWRLSKFYKHELRPMHALPRRARAG